LPPKTPAKPPLVIFIHGGLWTTPNDDPGRSIDFAENMSRRNVAVALVRYRLAPAFRHPAPIEDAAAAVAFLFRNAEKYGYNSQRIYLAGHANGAHTASLLALNDSYLETHGIKPLRLAGVIALNGVYDLNYARSLSSNHRQAIDDAFGDDPGMRRSASPINHAKADAPPFLIFNGSGDFLGAPVDTRKFADALRSGGHPRVEQWMISGRDHLSIIDMSGTENQARSLILNFVKGEPLPPALASLQTSRRLWQKTNYSTLPFWRHQDLIRSYPIDPRFMQRLVSNYGPLKHELLEWPLETFYAIDLVDYLDRVYPEKAAKPAFIVTKNIRDEKQYWARSEIAAHRPVIVVGIDDEKNLFRFSIFYRMAREYS
jgi:acetyl esterase/lipase